MTFGAYVLLYSPEICILHQTCCNLIEWGGVGTIFPLSPSAMGTLLKAVFSLMMSAILLHTCEQVSRSVDIKSQENSQNGSCADYVENGKDNGSECESESANEKEQKNENENEHENEDENENEHENENENENESEKENE